MSRACNHSRDDHGHHHDHHSHGHHHGHHHHIPKNFDRRFAIGVALNTGFAAVELVFGFVTNSLALVADALHNFSDVAGLLLAWGGAWLARQNPTAERTYGYRGASILAALGNAGLLLFAVGAITFEAIRRIGAPAESDGMTVMAVAGIGVLVNGFTAMMFWHGQKDDINIRGAFLHMVADAAISVGVVLAALGMMATGWLWLDPAISLAIAVIILAGTWGLAKDSLHLSLAGVPRHIDHAAVKAYLAGLPAVREVHDLHIWAMSTTETALTVHLIRPSAGLDDSFLRRVSKELLEKFKIHHPTIQIEAGDGGDTCQQAPEDVI